MAGFCAEDADTNVEISECGTRASVAGNLGGQNIWLGVRGRPGVIRGAYQFDVVLDQDCLMRVGWGNDSSDRIIGLDDWSFGYGGSAHKRNNRKFQPYGEEFGDKGTTISCLIDRRNYDKEAISYALNGKILGVAFELPSSLAGVPLFPAVSGKDAWSAWCLSTDLCFPMEGYRPLSESLASGDAVTGPIILGLNGEDADPGVEVSDDGTGAECKQAAGKNAWFGVRGRPGVLRGAYQYEVELCSKSLLRVGWGALRTRRAIGNDFLSFGYGGTGKKSSGGEYKDYGESYQGKSGAIISCLIDRRDPGQLIISFFLDGKDLGVAFDVDLNGNGSCDEPLFPALCGKGAWQVICRYKDFRFPVQGYQPLSEALAVRDAVPGQGLPGAIAPPTGVRVVPSFGSSAGLAHSKRRDLMGKLRALAEASTPVEGVVPGRRVVLHVHSGDWQGWHECDVVETDPMGCYLKHLSDDYHENVPWAFLNGDKYSMTLLPEAGLAAGEQEHCDTLGRTTSTSPTGAASSDFLESPVQGLTEWLQDSKLQLGAYVGRAIQWADEQGAVSMEEIVDNLTEFADALSLKPLQKKRLLEKGPGAATLASSLESKTAPAPASAASTSDALAPKRIMAPHATSSTTDLLKRGNLRVHDDLGAGLTLVVCEIGYFVSKIEEPGQRSLRKGDAIVAIGDVILLGLDCVELEARFQENFRDDAVIVKGNYLKLRQRPFGDLRNAIAQVQCERLPSPRPAAAVPLPDGMPRSLTQTRSASGSGLLRRGRLCLDSSGQAGLELSNSQHQAGYVVDAILAEPGQPDLFVGDAIVAISGSVLIGLDADEVEQCFGDAYCDGAIIVAGPHADLLVWPFTHVLCEVQRLMTPSAASAFVLERAKTY